MGNPAGVRRDFVALERRRMKAARLLDKGMSQSEVARRVGAHRQSVSRWEQQRQESGTSGLRKSGRAGRKPRLTDQQREQICRGLERGPEAFGYENGLWTLPRIAALIESECGIAYHPGHVWRLLRQLGWSCQKPTGRALERDEAKIAQWKRKRWPEIKKKPKKSGG